MFLFWVWCCCFLTIISLNTAAARSMNVATKGADGVERQVITYLPGYEYMGACIASQFRCLRYTPLAFIRLYRYDCQPAAWLCDGHRHCEDGADEADEVCKPATTTTSTFSPPKYYSSETGSLFGIRHETLRIILLSMLVYCVLLMLFLIALLVHCILMRNKYAGQLAQIDQQDGVGTV